MNQVRYHQIKDKLRKRISKLPSRLRRNR